MKYKLDVNSNLWKGGGGGLWLCGGFFSVLLLDGAAFVFDYIPSPSFTHTTGMTHFLGK